MERIYFGSFSESCLSHLESFSAEVIGTSKLPVVRAKCRELARHFPLMITAPDPTNYGYICIISKKDYINENEEFKRKFSTLGVKILRQRAINSSLLVACYKFTLLARMTPKWVQIGQWILKALEVSIANGTITLSIKPIKLTMNFLKPQHLQVSSSELATFTDNLNHVINDASIRYSSAIVLPKYILYHTTCTEPLKSWTGVLTAAHVLSVSHTVPQASGFENYDKIRVYWKTHHGIVLPASQKFFYEVHFRFNSTERFSYPGCCLCASKPIAIPSRDEISNGFISDVHARMSTICSYNIHFLNQPYAPSNTLQSSMTPVNATKPTNAAPIPIRTIKTPFTLGQPNIPPISNVSCRDTAEKHSDFLVPSLQTRPSGSTSCYVPIFKGGAKPNVEKRKINQESVHQPPSKRLCLSLSKKPSHSSIRMVPSTDKIDQQMIHSLHQSLNDSNTSDYGKGSKPSVSKDGCFLPIEKIKKCTVDTLKKWLQGNGVVNFRSKEKKEVIIQLVVQHLQSTGKQFIVEKS